MDDVQVMQMAEAAGRLVKNFFDADQLLQLRRVLSLDVILKRRRAQLDGDVTELPVALRAEIPHDILVRVGLAQQADFAVGQREAVGKQALHSHIALLKRSPKHERSLAAFAQHVLGIERDLSDFDEFI